MIYLPNIYEDYDRFDGEPTEEFLRCLFELPYGPVASTIDIDVSDYPELEELLTANSSHLRLSDGHYRI